MIKKRDHSVLTVTDLDTIKRRYQMHGYPNKSSGSAPSYYKKLSYSKKDYKQLPRLEHSKNPRANIASSNEDSQQWFDYSDHL